MIILDPSDGTKIENLVKSDSDLEVIRSRVIPYHKLLKRNVGFDLDLVYESKSYDMIKFNKDEKSCFWCIGNSNLFRET